ncbi:MAG: cobalamin-dependent protein [Chloroflexota bacterium]|nr:cobalamin-dependent protein [Dehalococcoidia bacterium]MDW8252749.1 cobalamin-dependent protein [Chloroflexota bacterium]
MVSASTNGLQPPRARTFGIGEAVERLRAEFPDVSISSLRFLEREGLLGPRRTAGGHRLFSEEDLERVRLIKRQQQQHRSLAEIRELLARRDRLGTPAELADRFVDAIAARDVRRAYDLIDEAGRVGVSMRTICLEILTPALVKIGDLWARGELDVAHEHLASAVVRDLLSALRAYQLPVRPNGRVAVAACAAHERHELGLRMVAALLEQEGWTVHFLGADTPLASTLQMVADNQADLLLISVGEPSSRAFVEAVAHEIASWSPSKRPKLVIGGRAAAEAAAGLPVDFVATSAEHLLAWPELRASRRPQPS